MNNFLLVYRSHDAVEAIVTPEKAGKVYKMELSYHGVWVSFKKKLKDEE